MKWCINSIRAAESLLIALACCCTFVGFDCFYNVLICKPLWINIHPQWYLFRVCLHILVSVCISSLRDFPWNPSFRLRYHCGSLLHFYSLLLPCALHKIITHEWPRLNPATLLLYIKGHLCSLVQNRAHSLALWPHVIIWETTGAVLCWK